MEYRKFISGEMFQDKQCNGRIPPVLGPTLRALVQAILCVPVVIISMQYWPLSYLTTNEYAASSWLEK
jgi:hypothetical protein